MVNILSLSSKKIRLIIIVAFVGLIIILILLFSSKNRMTSSVPVDDLEDSSPGTYFEGENNIPESYRETMPDGSTVEYGTQHGPLSQERYNELRKIIEERENKRSIYKRWFVAHGGSTVDDLIIEDRSGSFPQLVTEFRRLFTERAWLWTDSDLRDLGKIIIVKNSSDIGGAKGVYDHVGFYYTNGQITRWIGIIYIWGGGPASEALAHEYGHHYTSYWAAIRTNGLWNGHWPVDSAGDYYQLRPLSSSCVCEAISGCPYHLSIWEILAEDFRYTITTDPALRNTPHSSINEICPGTTIKVGQPDPVGVSNYLRALPISTDIPSPTISSSLISIVTPASTPSVTPTSIPAELPTITPRSIIDCPTSQPGIKSIKLGIGPPCFVPEPTR